MSKQSSEKSGLATAGMILGIVAIVGAWIPFINFVSVILGVLALILGGVSLFQKRSIGKATAGVVLGILTIVLFVAMYGGAAANNSDSKDTSKVTGNSSSQSSEDKSSEKTVFNVGEVISFDGKEVAVNSVDRNWSSGNQFIVPDSGNEFVKVNVTIKNTSSNEISYNTFDWKMQDSNGNIVSPASSTYSVDGAISSGELAEGGTKTGFLVFEVPSGDNELVLRYEPSFWSSKKVEIRLN